MGDKYSGFVSYYDLVLPHPSESAVWMVQQDQSFLLPGVQVEMFLWWREIGELTKIIRKELGDGCRGLRCVSSVDNFEKRVSRRVWLIENRSDSPIRQEGRWVGADELAELRLAVPEHRTLIPGCLEEAADRSPYHHPAWTCAGWADGAISWFEEQLSELGYTLTSPIDYEYSWPLAAVLRAYTTSGNVYMKATSTLPTFVDETVLTARLASLFPNFVPAPLAIEPEQKWMLLPDLGYPIRSAPEKQKVDAILRYGQLQRQSVEHVDELLSIGCPDHRSASLESAIEMLLNADPTVSRLDVVERERLRSMGPRLKEIVNELAGGRVPDTLFHGDLHLGNVAWCDDRFQYFDWGQGCISHPFLEAWYFAEESEIESFPTQEYLTLWIDYASMDQLKKVWELARPLSTLIETFDQYLINTALRQEPEEFPESLSGGLRGMMERAG